MPDDKFMKALLLTCSNLREVFNRITNSDNTVSIKVSVIDNHVLTSDDKVKSLVRDTHYTEKVKDLNDNGSEGHTVSQNTPLLKVYNNVRKVVQNKDKLLKSDRKVTKYKNHCYYMNNDIANSKDYDITFFDGMRGEILPHKSELIYPIIPSNMYDDFQIVGFICVGNESVNSFKANYDVAILEMVSDCLYDLFMTRVSNSQNN